MRIQQGISQIRLNLLFRPFPEFGSLSTPTFCFGLCTSFNVFPNGVNSSPRYNPSSIIFWCNIGRESSKQFCVGAVNRGMQCESESSVLPARNVPLQWCFQVAWIQRLCAISRIRKPGAIKQHTTLITPSDPYLLANSFEWSIFPALLTAYLCQAPWSF
jgi:hypothetical protein